jgi:predicted lipoprotein with Yx(FWY)xxD motif
MFDLHTRLPGRAETLAVASLILLAACSGATPTTVAPTATPAPPAASAPAVPTPSPASSVTVTVSSGGFLVAPDGRTLYVFDMDPIGTSTSACTNSDGCDVTWPALFVATGGRVTAGTGLTGTLALITGEDGGTQIAYKGRPLYEYSGDTAPGQTTGDGVDGVWHTATP